MIIYIFEHPLLPGQFRKIVSSFPLPEQWLEQLENAGWIRYGTNHDNR